MIKNKRITQITEALNGLDKDDIYSMMLFVLYKLKDDPEYLTLSELCYVLEGDSLSKFLSYFGGMTLKIPTLRELRLVLQGLSLYELINLEKATFEEGLKALTTDEFNTNELKEVYAKIANVVAEYEFDRK